MANRKEKSLKNLIIGILYQVLLLVLNFVCKTFLIQKLGRDVLGINSLYSSILSILSLAELGMGSVLIFSLYKSVAQHDEEKMAAYMNYFKKIYNIIALVVLVLGLCVAPFLKFIVSPDVAITDSDLFIYYILFLSNAALSYLLSYKQTIIEAHQDISIIKIFWMVNLTIRSILRIVLLFVIPDYRIYILAEIVCNFLTNLALSIYADKKYPFIKNKQCTLSKEEKNSIKSNIKDTFLYKLGNVIISNTSSIIISVMISTIIVGYVSNYNTIISSLSGFLGILNSAVFASIGSVLLEKNKEKSLKIFRTLLLMFHYLSAFCAIAMFVTFNDFILLWLNDSQYVLDTYSVLAMCAYFYLQNIAIPVTCYRENYGLFKKVKFYLIISAGLNLVLSILLCYLLGLVGIFLGLILSRIFVVDALEPPYLYKEVFETSAKDYYLRQGGMFILTIASGVISYYLCSLIQGVSILNFIYKGLICFAITTLLFFLCTFKSNEMKYLKEMASNLISGYVKKKKSKKVGIISNEQDRVKQENKVMQENIEKQENKLKEEKQEKFENTE